MKTNFEISPEKIEGKPAGEIGGRISTCPFDKASSPLDKQSLVHNREIKVDQET